MLRFGALHEVKKLLEKDPELKEVEILEIEVRPHKDNAIRKRNYHLPILNPTADMNPKFNWKAQQRDLYIVTPDGRLQAVLNLDSFDPHPGVNSTIGNHYLYLKRFIKASENSVK